MVGQREVPQMVGREHQLVAVRGFAAWWMVERHPGVVNYRVEAVQPERVHGCLERSEIGQVQGHVLHLGAGDARADGSDRVFGLRPVSAAENDRGPGAGQLLGDEIPDARVAAGDQEALSPRMRQSVSVPSRGLGYGGHGGLPEARSGLKGSGPHIHSRPRPVPTVPGATHIPPAGRCPR